MVLESTYEHYFELDTFSESPVMFWSLVGLAVIEIVAFFSIGFGDIAAIIGVLGIGWFMMGMCLHLVLFVIGRIHHHGIIGFARLSALVVGGLLVVGIVGFLALYGWFIPLAFIAAFFSQVPEPYKSVLLPFFIVFMVVVAAGWYSKGLKLFDSV